MNKLKSLLLIVVMIALSQAKAQSTWNYSIGLGTSLHTGNVNSCNLSNDAAVTRNDSILALDFHYRLLYSSLILKNSGAQHWEETNFEINGGIMADLYQYGKYSPFLACEMLTNKYKGYDLRLSGLVGFKYRLWQKPSVYDYSISAAVVYDRTDFTDPTTLLSNNCRISIRPKIKQRISENLTLMHRTFFQPSVFDFHDIIINSLTQLQTKITKKLFLDLSFSYEYRSLVPSENYRKHDMLSEVSLRLKF